MRSGESVIVRQATPEDANRVFELATNLPPLVPHTWYIYWDLFTSFSNSCFLAEEANNKKLVGLATSHPMTNKDPLEWFSWQIGIIPEHRGSGLLERLQDNIVDAAVESGAVALQGTVEPNNPASLRAFEKLAKRLGTTLEKLEEIPMPTGPDILYRLPLLSNN